MTPTVAVVGHVEQMQFVVVERLPSAGEVVHAYSNLNANDHVTETMTAVKAWRAKHPKK